MSDEFSWNETKRLVYQRAHGCCEYCQTCEANIGQSMHVEHIDPSGGDLLDNLCLSCPNCNLSKAKATRATDPETKQEVVLFNPRTENWSEHFKWSADYVRLYGLSAIGRATTERLKINQDRILVARHRWAESGYHPPM
jgi:hypothetical protein